MSTKSSVMYDEKTDIHIYHELLDNQYYISCNFEKMQIDGKLAKEIEKAYAKIHGLRQVNDLTEDKTKKAYKIVLLDLLEQVEYAKKNLRGEK